jgi:hypothetical protein
MSFVRVLVLPSQRSVAADVIDGLSSILIVVVGAQAPFVAVMVYVPFTVGGAIVGMVYVVLVPVVGENEPPVADHDVPVTVLATPLIVALPLLQYAAGRPLITGLLSIRIVPVRAQAPLVAVTVTVWF